jgi:uncharacterized DUF497 family protein
VHTLDEERNPEWDPRKADANYRKHGVRFSEAATVLSDELAMTVEDTRIGEQRFVTVGESAEHRLLVVIYTWRGERARLISAREATPKERRNYEGG